MPYSPHLLLARAHTNVEACSTVMAYKYVYKGPEVTVEALEEGQRRVTRRRDQALRRWSVHLGTLALLRLQYAQRVADCCIRWPYTCPMSRFGFCCVCLNLDFFYSWYILPVASI